MPENLQRLQAWARACPNSAFASVATSVQACMLASYTWAVHPGCPACRCAAGTRNRTSPYFFPRKPRRLS
ncbi:hypothetical protein D8I35_07220 [Corticibacter populi]|uniref:Uncharacterized protein n=1 Tax=Corticibacter populi TaxID=1550736 RepID=A0A3M6QTH1_9BURK|nr:hypothetical protein D8I35_07220 [Corticibacter populi]